VPRARQALSRGNPQVRCPVRGRASRPTSVALHVRGGSTPVIPDEPHALRIHYWGCRGWGSDPRAAVPVGPPGCSMTWQVRPGGGGLARQPPVYRDGFLDRGRRLFPTGRPLPAGPSGAEFGGFLNRWRVADRPTVVLGQYARTPLSSVVRPPSTTTPYGGGCSRGRTRSRSRVRVMTARLWGRLSGSLTP
jgi:hypothetical protein